MILTDGSSKSCTQSPLCSDPKPCCHADIRTPPHKCATYQLLARLSVASQAPCVSCDASAKHLLLTCGCYTFSLAASFHAPCVRQSFNFNLQEQERRTPSSLVGTCIELHVPNVGWRRYLVESIRTVPEV
jgi:hypothetical protein